MMKKASLFTILLLISSSAAFADQINFVFSFGAPGTMSAQSSGFSAGPAPLIQVTDATTNVTKLLSGTWTTSAGPASSIVAVPGTLLATFTPGSLNSVFIHQGSTVLLSGITGDAGRFLAASGPNGTAAYFADFLVTEVDPAVLAMFRLGPGFAPIGTVSATGGTVNIAGLGATATVGGGSVTIQTVGPPIAEGSTLVLFGSGLVGVGWVARRRLFCNA